MYKFAHYNFNVLDLDKSIKFYQDTLNLKLNKKIESEDGSFILAFLKDDISDFELELTWLKDRKDKYNLGDNEFHLAFVTDNFDESYLKHKEMNVICYENKNMGIYFISDPDNYWIEIIPGK